MNFKVQSCLYVVLLFLSVCSGAYAQENKESYFISLEGDTLYAIIKKGNDSKNTYGFKYKRNINDGSYMVIRANEVKEVVIGIEKYISAYVPENNYNQYIFLKVLVDGEAKLYSATDTSGVSSLYFSNKGGKIFHLNSRTYSGSLRIGLTECDAIALDDQEFMKAYKYTRKDLSKFFLEYNKCVNPQSPALELVKRNKIYITKGALAGIKSISMITQGAAAYPGDYGTKLNYNMGLFGEVHFSKSFSTLLELQYFTYSGELHYSERYSEEVTFKFIQVPLLLKYSLHLNNGRIRPYLNAGFHINRLIEQKGTNTYDSTQYDYNMRMNKSNFGGTAGMGIALFPFSNKTALKIEGRYNGTPLYWGVNYFGDLSSYQLLVGISF